MGVGGVRVGNGVLVAVFIDMDVGVLTGVTGVFVSTTGIGEGVLLGVLVFVGVTGVGVRGIWSGSPVSVSGSSSVCCSGSQVSASGSSSVCCWG